MNTKNNLFFILTIIGCSFFTVSFCAEGSSWRSYLPGFGRATDGSGDFFGLASATAIFGRSLENAAGNVNLDGHISFDESAFTVFADLRRTSENLVDTSVNLTNIQATAKVDDTTLHALDKSVQNITQALDRTMAQADDIADRIANPVVTLSPNTTTQLGIIGLAAATGYFATSVLKSIAEKYIYRSAELHAGTDSAIAAASFTLLVGSAYSIYYSGKLAGNTPRVTPKRMRQQREERARLFELADTPSSSQMVLRRN